MARSQNSFQKKQRESKKKKKREEKFQKKLDKKNKTTSGDLEDMLAYVDDMGNIISDEPESTPDIEPQDHSTKSINNSNENRNS